MEWESECGRDAHEHIEERKLLCCFEDAVKQCGLKAAMREWLAVLVGRNVVKAPCEASSVYGANRCFDLCTRCVARQQRSARLYRGDVCQR